MTLQIMCGVCVPPEGAGSIDPVFFVPSVKPGECVSYSCHWCHSRLLFQFSSVEYKEVEGFAAKASLSKVRQEKLPYKPGEPLPLNGACAHYKKSYRWLRFPCCGRVFPCDECHDEQAEPKHRADWAKRMICGFCSKEQPFSQKPCGCGHSLSTASMKKSAFWEGGKGTRNRTTMSRKDSHKHKGANKS